MASPLLDPEQELQQEEEHQPQDQGWSPPSFDSSSLWQLVRSRASSGLTGKQVMGFHTAQLKTPAKDQQGDAEAQKQELPRQEAQNEAQNEVERGLDQAALQKAIQAVLAKVPKDYQQYARASAPLILKQCAMARMHNPRQVAYILATAQHEARFGAPSGKHDEPLVEDANGFGRRKAVKDGRPKSWTSRVHTNGRRVYGSSREDLEKNYWNAAYGSRLGNRKGTTDARDYRGRGFVQLTGRGNYEKMSKVLNAQGFTYTHEGKSYGGKGEPIDLVKNFEHVNQVPVLAARILVEGSKQGLFTGQRLDQYVNDKKTDYTNARRVINGTDRAADIAALAVGFQKALETGDLWKQAMEKVPAQGFLKVPIPKPNPRRVQQ